MFDLFRFNFALICIAMLFQKSLNFRVSLSPALRPVSKFYGMGGAIPKNDDKGSVELLEDVDKISFKGDNLKLSKVLAGMAKEISGIRKIVMEYEKERQLAFLSDLAVWTRDFLFADALRHAPFYGEMAMFDDKFPSTVESVLPGLGYFLITNKIPLEVYDNHIEDYLKNVDMFKNHMKEVFKIDVTAVYKTINAHHTAVHEGYPNYRYPITHPINIRKLEMLLKKVEARAPYEEKDLEALRTQLTNALNMQYKNVFRRTSLQRFRQPFFQHS